MMKIERGYKEHRHHTLFVEGQNENADDPVFIRQLFAGEPYPPRIVAMKSSSSIKSVADSLHEHHPTYYFLIDRDHHDDEYVEDCWVNFPDPHKSNLLVWRKKEMENYFLDPAYISQSQYCVKQEETARKVLDFADERIFIDVVNRVIIEVRERFKENWIKIFDQPSKFTSKENALSVLLSMSEFEEFNDKVRIGISQKELEYRFNCYLEEMSGGKDKLKFGCGNWIDRMSGKKILTQLINTNCFVVKNSRNENLTGNEKFQEVIKDLLRNAKNQPDDFIQLKNLIIARINGVK